MFWRNLCWGRVRQSAQADSSRSVSQFIDSRIVQNHAPFLLTQRLRDQDQRKHGFHRDVYLYVNVFSISEVQTSSESFQAYFYFRATWVEPLLKKGQVLDENTWQPRVQIMNAVSTPEIIEPHFKEVSWRTSHDGSAVLSWSAKYRVCCREKFELRSFPFDTQHLAISFTSHELNTRLLEDCYDGVCSVLNQEYTILPEFSIRGPFCIPHKKLSGGKYSVMDVRLSAARRGSYYVWNLYVPLFLLTAMLFAVFCVGAGDISDRLSLTLTIVLSSVAYKYIVSQDLPHINYLTMADLYVLGNFIFTALVVLQNAWAGWITSLDKEYGMKFDNLGLKVLLTVFAGGNIVYMASMWWLYKYGENTTDSEEDLMSDDAHE